jgi:hypothetical protein
MILQMSKQVEDSMKMPLFGAQLNTTSIDTSEQMPMHQIPLSSAELQSVAENSSHPLASAVGRHRSLASNCLENNQKLWSSVQPTQRLWEHAS